MLKNIATAVSDTVLPQTMNALKAKKVLQQNGKTDRYVSDFYRNIAGASKFKTLTHDLLTVVPRVVIGSKYRLTSVPSATKANVALLPAQPFPGVYKVVAAIAKPVLNVSFVLAGTLLGLVVGGFMIPVDLIANTVCAFFCKKADGSRLSEAVMMGMIDGGFALAAIANKIIDSPVALVDVASESLNNMLYAAKGRPTDKGSATSAAAKKAVRFDNMTKDMAYLQAVMSPL